MDLPQIARAVIQRNRGTARVLCEETIKLPDLEQQEILVRVISCALNPTDARSFDNDDFGDGAVLGCDFAGIVQRVGPAVTTLKVGDRVGAFIWGGERHPVGAYATHCIADERIAFKLPAGFGFPEASVIPLAATTAWLALLSEDCLNIPRASTEEATILVWGGASTVGMYAIQMARILGLNVVATCSPKNMNAVRNCGASVVFDYHDVDVESQIAGLAPPPAYALDTIGSNTTLEITARLIEQNRGTLCSVKPSAQNYDNLPASVTVTSVFVFTAFLKRHVYRKTYTWPAHPKDHALSAELFRNLPEWITQGYFKPQALKRMGQLSAKSVADAMQLFRSNKISGEKYCFDVGKIDTTD